MNFLGHEAVRMIENAMQGYKPDGDPMWLLRTVRTICVQYVRALGVAYGGMPAAKKLGLCRLMLWEGMQWPSIFQAFHRALMSIGDDEADKFYISVL